MPIIQDLPEDVIAYLIIAKGWGVNPSLSADWSVFSVNERQSPDNIITVYGTAGDLQGRTHVDGEMAEFPGIQVRVRSVDPVVGKMKAHTIANGFDQIYKYSVSAPYQATTGQATRVYEVQSIRRTTPVLSLGRQVGSSDRYLFTVNALLTLKQTS